MSTDLHCSRLMSIAPLLSSFCSWELANCSMPLVFYCSVIASVVNKDLTFKAKDLTLKAKAKDLTSEQVEGPL